MPNLLARWRSMFRPQVYFYALGSDAPTQVLNYTAQRLYQSQDNLKAVVDFLANSIAQLPLNVYTRNDETDRERDRTSPAARLLWLPNSEQTEFEFVRALMTEYFVFGTVYVLVLPDAKSRSGWQMWIVPSEWVTDTRAANAYSVQSITVIAGQSGNAVEIPRENFIQFKTYSPGNPGGYISPISALRQTLQEQIEAGNFRKQLWHSSGRLNAQIVRPANVEPWTDEQRNRFVTAFREAWGAGGSKAGSIPILEDGMEIKPFQTSFKESQWMESVKLSRESCAAAYGVNPSLIWHTDTQTYASSKDNARALYAECLGPILQMLQQRINSFLLPMVGADMDTYVEFDLTEKLKGSFEERAAILQSAVGGPWMTRNEARADNNLPPVEGGDELIVPLNVVEGGQASPNDTHMEEQEPMAIEENGASKILAKSEAEKLRIKARSTQEEDEKMAGVLRAFWKRQAKAVLSRIGAKSAKWWDEERWNKELTDDIEPLIDAIADAHGEEVAKAIGSEYHTDQTRKYLRVLAEGRAKAINESTRQKLQDAIDDEDEENTPAHVFEVRESKDAETFGRSLAIGVAGWAATREAPAQAEQQGFHKTVEKRWITGTNPRPEHAAMNGETVPIDETFSNGCKWPGDEDGDPDTTCGCNCSTEVIITVA
jgi:HK97 family phage portal protein